MSDLDCSSQPMHSLNLPPPTRQKHAASRRAQHQTALRQSEQRPRRPAPQPATFLEGGWGLKEEPGHHAHMRAAGARSRPAHTHSPQGRGRIGTPGHVCEGPCRYPHTGHEGTSETATHFCHARFQSDTYILMATGKLQMFFRTADGVGPPSSRHSSV